MTSIGERGIGVLGGLAGGDPCSGNCSVAFFFFFGHLPPLVRVLCLGDWLDPEPIIAHSF